MSLIHEALKKVERQRQLGSAPTLDSPRFRRRRPRWPWVLLLLLIFVLAGAWAWRGPLVHKARTVVSLLTGSKVAGSDGASTTAQTATGNPVLAPGKSNKPAGPGKPLAGATKSATQTQTAAGKAASPVPKQTGQPKPGPGQAKNPAATANATAAQAKPVSPPPPNTGNPATADPAKPAAQPAAVGQLKKKGPPMYWELPYSQRRDIPDLSISMHMYTENPADRFVIIDGVRQVEGDTLPSGLKLIAINPDSITLDKDGQDFQVPRQGSH